MFLFGAPSTISYSKRSRLLDFLKGPSLSYTWLPPFKSNLFRQPYVGSSWYEVNGSLQANSSLSHEELERKRQYLERKYRFFEKEFASIQSCTFCKGSGKLPCKFCNGTGFMMLGDALVCSVSGNCDCVVCRAQGEIDCERCRGTGHIAGWL
ncbi:hypothetical protein GpartN1_g3618.t1 [Galdieria partita]|uniref:Uncharacterized protein n=1 Tax=Galdieria partita TaxID=83374 RepID=A0A9C7UQT6_9RHOD|nr:hypothetical protein GpartN1_g3618.t1 [Galdieria partita]